MVNLFVSHITNETELAKILKRHISQDFLGMTEIFVSSDAVSIAAGEEWLKSIQTALEKANIELVLCSRDSVQQPWVNFEAGVGWARGIPVIPICHSGLRPSQLPMPLAALQGVIANTDDGLEKVYRQIALVLKSQLPTRTRTELLAEVAAFEQRYVPKLAAREGEDTERDQAIWVRMQNDLEEPKYVWRTLKRLADRAGGLSEDTAADFLRRRTDVVFGRSKQSGELIVRLKNRLPDEQGF